MIRHWPPSWLTVSDRSTHSPLRLLCTRTFAITMPEGYVLRIDDEVTE